MVDSPRGTASNNDNDLAHESRAKRKLVRLRNRRRTRNSCDRDDAMRVRVTTSYPKSGQSIYLEDWWNRHTRPPGAGGRGSLHPKHQSKLPRWWLGRDGYRSVVYNNAN